MSAFHDRLPDIVIPNGSAVSNVISGFADAIAIGIMAPDTLDALTFTIEIHQDEGAASTENFQTLQSGDPVADVLAPAATKARVYHELAAAGSFRIRASGNVAAERRFPCWKQWQAR